MHALAPFIYALTRQTRTQDNGTNQINIAPTEKVNKTKLPAIRDMRSKRRLRKYTLLRTQLRCRVAKTRAIVAGPNDGVGEQLLSPTAL